MPCFKIVPSGREVYCFLSNLAYLDEEDDVEEKEYAPRKGDKIRLEYEVVSTFYHNPLFDERVVDIELDKDTSYSIRESAFTKHATLVSRAPRFARTLTKEEAEKLLSEKLGEEVSIE